MRAELITIGDEILIGQILNTNAGYLGEKLYGIGIPVVRTTVVGDDEEQILEAFRNAYERFDVVLVTGGLGPTHDNITRKVVCRFFNTDLVMNEEALENIKRRLAQRNLPMTEPNEEQALVPRTAIVIQNHWGTAPGTLFDRNGRYFFVMPGVPSEMRGMTENFVLPYLEKKTTGSVIRHQTLKTTGIPESFLYQLLGNIDDITQGAKLAFLPRPQGVMLRITVHESDVERAERKIADVEQRIRAKAGEYIYSVGDEELEEVIGRLLMERKLTIAVAESCTGGHIANLITNISGSSNYFERGVVAYSNQSKVEILGVPQALIEQHGAVSRGVAEEMAAGVRRIAQTDIGISTTGIAGPTGGTPTKPVGLVWIGYSDKNSTFAKDYYFGDDRLRFKIRASQAALEMVRRKLLAIE